MSSFMYHLSTMAKDKIVVFPIIIIPTNDSKIKYSVHVPDLNRDTQGKSIPDAIAMAKDLIGTMSLVEKLPKSNIKVPNVKDNEIATLVTVNISKYKRKYDHKVVNKTLTIPSYLNEEAKEANINFSALLTKALEKRLEE